MNTKTNAGVVAFANYKMKNEILKIILNEDRGMIGELNLDLYEMGLLAYPYNLNNWSKFAKLRAIFQ